MAALLPHYASSDASDGEQPPACIEEDAGLARVAPPPLPPPPTVCPAPDISPVASATATTSVGTAVARYDVLAQGCKTLTHNVPYDAMMLPLQGPANPHAARNDVENGRIGVAESFVMDEHVFRQQLRAFHRAEIGEMAAGGSGGSGGSSGSHRLLKHSAVVGIPHMPVASNARKRALGPETADGRFILKRKSRGDPGVLDGDNAYVGPWAEYQGLSDSDADAADAEERAADDEQLRRDEESDVEAAKRAAAAAAQSASATQMQTQAKTIVTSAMAARIKLITPGSERTVFHARSERDYQGRTYMSALGSKYRHTESSTPEECFVPKKCVYTMRGHSKGVNVIRLFPNTAHLLLSASMDCKVKIWNVSDTDGGDSGFGRRGAMLRTYLGHNKAVRDVCFDTDGARFLSASYDRYIKLWDTESGKCISCFTTGKLPNCVTFYPGTENPHVFLTGQSDHKIYQFDLRTGNIEQEYDEHLGAVNTITFVDNNRRFVTTSDDKSLRAWEFGIPVVIKYIAEPHMHSMPAVTLSPNQKWLACQSLDNQIILYGATDRFRMNRQKGFRGHVVAGYACQVNFSPDGRYIMSGDSLGQMHFWDFKSCRMFKKQKAHDNVVMGCVWHPYETSRVFTCSWDNTIKIWD